MIPGLEHALASSDGLSLIVILTSFFGIIFGQFKIPLALLGLSLRLFLWIRSKRKKKFSEAEG